jgi:hypothetical protein
MNKKSWMSVLTAAAILVTIGSASLSAGPIYQMRANIPFGFMVGSEAFPAGSYTVARLDTVVNAYVLRSADGGKNVVFVPIGVYSAKSRQEDSLVFNRYGDQYFLSQMWSIDDLVGSQLLPSNHEHEVSVTMNQEIREVVKIAATR